MREVGRHKGVGLRSDMPAGACWAARSLGPKLSPSLQELAPSGEALSLSALLRGPTSTPQEGVHSPSKCVEPLRSLGVLQAQEKLAQSLEKLLCEREIGGWG